LVQILTTRTEKIDLKEVIGYMIKMT